MPSVRGGSYGKGKGSLKYTIRGKNGAPKSKGKSGSMHSAMKKTSKITGY